MASPKSRPLFPHRSLHILHFLWPPWNLYTLSPCPFIEIFICPTSTFFDFLKIPIPYVCPPHPTSNQYYQYVTAHQAAVKLCQTLHATSCRNTPIVNMMQQDFLMILVLEARLTPYISSSSFWLYVPTPSLNLLFHCLYKPYPSKVSSTLPSIVRWQIKVI